MKDEIKEIVDKLQKVANRETASRNALMEMPYTDYQLLLDYITNLQDLLNKTNDELVSYVDRCIELEEENKELKKKITFNEKSRRKMQQSLMEQIEDYKSRNEKAIEHIKQYSNCSGSIIDDKFVIEKIDEIYNGTQLLNILTGGDKE